MKTPPLLAPNKKDHQCHVETKAPAFAQEAILAPAQIRPHYWNNCGRSGHVSDLGDLKLTPAEEQDFIRHTGLKVSEVVFDDIPAEQTLMVLAWLAARKTNKVISLDAVKKVRGSDE